MTLVMLASWKGETAAYGTKCHSHVKETTLVIL